MLLTLELKTKTECSPKLRLLRPVRNRAIAGPRDVLQQELQLIARSARIIEPIALPDAGPIRKEDRDANAGWVARCGVADERLGPGGAVVGDGAVRDDVVCDLDDFGEGGGRGGGGGREAGVAEDGVGLGVELCECLGSGAEFPAGWRVEG